MIYNKDWLEKKIFLVFIYSNISNKDKIEIYVLCDSVKKLC